MKKHTFTLLLALLFASAAMADNLLKENFIFGDPAIKSINALAFGPENILFIGDAQSASIVAIDLAGLSAEKPASEIQINKVDVMLAELLGTTADQLNIIDMAVDPASGQIYLAVQHADGTPVLFRLSGESFVHVPLDQVSHSKTMLENPVDADAKDGRGRELRMWAISDLNYMDGKVMVTGLSNKEFGSTFRTIAFPFSKDQAAASLEIYHAAHGKYETQSPVKTFLPMQLNGKPHLVAGYTCTPLVVFPMDEIKAGEHTKGKTVAELGNWNTPLDIVEMERDGQRYLLLANSARALMKIKVADIEKFNDYLTTPVEESSATAGVDFIALPFVNVLQLAKLDDNTFLMLQRKANGELTLLTGGGNWL